MRRNTVLSSYITLQNNRDGENMFCEAEFKMFELKNNVRIKYNYRMNQVTNTLWNKTYVPNYKRFSNRTILDKYDANDYISFLIEKSTPFWVGRFGRTELLFIYHYLRNKYYSDNKDFNEYSCAMKSQFRKTGNQMSGTGNHQLLCASLLAHVFI